MTGCPPPFQTMKRLALLCHALLLASSPVSLSEPVDEVLRRSAADFPRLNLGKDASGFANLHLLEPPAKPVEFEGKRFNAIRFRTPPKMDGHLARMHIVADPGNRKDEHFGWFIIPLEPDPDVDNDRVMVHYSPFKARAFRAVLDRFPKANRFYLERLELDPDKEYLFGFSSSKPVMPVVGVAITVQSKAGIETYGSLPTGLHVHGLDDPPTAEQDGTLKAIAGAITDDFKASGSKTPPEKLEAALSAASEDGASFQRLYRELCARDSISSPAAADDWQIAMWLWLHHEAKRRGYDFESEEAAIMLMHRMSDRERSARLVETAAELAKSYWRMGFSVRSTSYPDLGPGLECFPEVRRREIPLHPPIGAARVNRRGYTNQDDRFTDLIARHTDAVSRMYAMNGKWEIALEWQLWIREAAEASLEEEENPEISAAWQAATWQIADYLTRLGFYEAAAAEYARTLEAGREVGDMDWTAGSAKLRQIELAARMGLTTPRTVAEIDAVVAGWEKKLVIPDQVLHWLDYLRGRCRINSGEVEEGFKLVTRAAEAGSYSAQMYYVPFASKQGTDTAIDWPALIAKNRGFGNRAEEWEIFDAYADHLERNGRHAEEIRVRWSAAASAEAFGMHPHLRSLSAKLARALGRWGENDIARDTAERTRRMIAEEGRTPPRVAREASGILAAEATAPAGKTAGPGSSMLQPASAEIPSDPGDTPVACFTLVHTGNRPVTGSLKFSGMPVNASHVAKERKVLARISDEQGTGEIKDLQLLPGTSLTITLMLSGKAARTGDVTVTWTSDGQPDQVSTCRFRPDEKHVRRMTARRDPWLMDPYGGGSFALIRNSEPPFNQPVPVRALASRPARIEMSDPKTGLVFVDSQGNGGFRDPGDVLFLAYSTDFFPTVSGEGLASVLVKVWPENPLEEGGLEVTVQHRIDGEWRDFATYRFVP